MDSNTQQVVSDLGHELRTVALLSPKLAFMLALGYPLAYRTRSIRFQWDTVAGDTSILGRRFTDKLFQMFWVWDISYTVRRPQANDGVFGKLEQDRYATLAPYIDVDIRAVGRENWHITDGLQPLESVAGPGITNNRRNAAWVITQDSNLSIDAVNRRTFNADEVPYIVDIAVSGLELSGCQLPGCGYDDAVCWLQEKNILPKEFVGGRLSG